jgi:hypothetical protein
MDAIWAGEETCQCCDSRCIRRRARGFVPCREAPRLTRGLILACLDDKTQKIVTVREPAQRRKGNRVVGTRERREIIAGRIIPLPSGNLGRRQRRDRVQWAEPVCRLPRSSDIRKADIDLLCGIALPTRRLFLRKSIRPSVRSVQASLENARIHRCERSRVAAEPRIFRHATGGPNWETGYKGEADTQFAPGMRVYSAHNRLHVNAPTSHRFARSYTIASKLFGDGPKTNGYIRNGSSTQKLLVNDKAAVPSPTNEFSLEPS